MIGKLLDSDGLEVTLENIWDLTQLILTMDEFAGMKLNINGRYVEDYVYKVYAHDGAGITCAINGEKHVGNTKVIMGYYDSIYDAIGYIEEVTSMVSDIEYVEYTYDNYNESNVYTIKTENGFTLDIVEQERRVLIWR